jgi:hypothetical protein
MCACYLKGDTINNLSLLPLQTASADGVSYYLRRRLKILNIGIDMGNLLGALATVTSGS